MNSTFAGNGGNGQSEDPSVPIHTIWDLDEAPYNLSRLFVFLDEDAGSIDDGHFFVRPRPQVSWSNVPSDRHGGSGTFSFADGHAETKHWLAAKGAGKMSNSENNLKDLQWLQDHAHVQVENP